MGEAAENLDPPDRALTVAEFAASYCYSIQTVYTMIDKGELGCVRRPGCAIRILPRHVAEWEDRFECPASPQKKPTLVSSESTGAAPGTSDGHRQAPAAPRSSARAARMRRKLASS